MAESLLLFSVQQVIKIAHTHAQVLHPPENEMCVMTRWMMMMVVAHLEIIIKSCYLSTKWNSQQIAHFKSNLFLILLTQCFQSVAQSTRDKQAVARLILSHLMEF